MAKWLAWGVRRHLEWTSRLWPAGPGFGLDTINWREFFDALIKFCCSLAIIMCVWGKHNVQRFISIIEYWIMCVFVLTCGCGGGLFCLPIILHSLPLLYELKLRMLATWLILTCQWVRDLCCLMVGSSFFSLGSIEIVLWWKTLFGSCACNAWLGY